MSKYLIVNDKIVYEIETKDGHVVSHNSDLTSIMMDMHFNNYFTFEITDYSLQNFRTLNYSGVDWYFGHYINPMDENNLIWLWFGPSQLRVP